jgi:hypothetical protein
MYKNLCGNYVGRIELTFLWQFIVAQFWKLSNQCVMELKKSNARLWNVIQMSTLFHSHSCHINFRTIAIIKFWTSIFYHRKKITLNHAWLKLSHMNDKIVLKFIYNLSIWAMTKCYVYSFCLFIFYILLIKTSFYSICLIFKTSWMCCR